MRDDIRMLGKSLAARCFLCVVVYAFALLAIASAVGAASNALFDNAFPSMETVLAHEDDLARDAFDGLRSSDLENCKIVIFDASGTRLYASSETAAASIRASDLAMINDYEESTFYEVFQETVDSEVRYRIMLCAYEASSDYNETVRAWCTLDADLTILEGTLFSGRDALTEREFDFIRGVYNAQMSIERLDYRTEDGAARTLVLAAPLVNDVRYQQILDEVQQLGLYAVPAVLVATVVAAWCLIRLVRNSTRPLNHAIDAYRHDEATDARAGEAQMVSEYIPVYRNFTELMDELRAARREQQRMIADVSHDLKTPLTVIRGYAKAFCDGKVPPEKADDYHRAMNDKAVQAAELIDALFSYARMEHPEFEAQLVRVDANALVREAALRVLPAVEQAGDALEVCVEGACASVGGVGAEYAAASAAEGDTPAISALAETALHDDARRAACDGECCVGRGAESAPLMVEVDVQLFRRTLLNLIGNACAHNAAGIRIRVSCAARRDRVVVTVADTGAGFPPEIAARAFEPFVTENTARTAGGGTGLGLAIARRCVELMGGAIYLDDHPTAPWAAEVVIELPRA